jgi:hypothetical protein
MAQVSEETRLQALASLNLLDTPREERFDRLVRLAKKLFDVPTAVVSLVDEDRLDRVLQSHDSVKGALHGW